MTLSHNHLVVETLNFERDGAAQFHLDLRIEEGFYEEMAMTDDRRQHQRVDVPLGLIADDGMWAVNLSETGMALWSERLLIRMRQ